MADVSLFYLPFTANGWCECIPLIGCIVVDNDPVRTAGVLFGTFLLLMNMYLVTVRIRRTDKQITETEKSNNLAKFHQGITNNLAKLHQGITMLYAGNAITQAGGVEYLHRLAKEAKENKQQLEEVLRVFCVFLKYALPSEEDRSRPAKNLILRKMFIDKENKEIYPNEKIDLQWAFLPGAHLSWAHLKEANLRGAHLRGAHLKEANLRGADLMKAKLQGANLEKANLEKAHLVGADLERAHLERANLERANLKEADLEKANLVGADLMKAHLEGAHLKEAHLNGADLRGANLSGAHLWGAHLHYATIYEGEREYITGAMGTGDVIWMSASGTSFEWRKKMYDRQGLKRALVSELVKLQNEPAKLQNDLSRVAAQMAVYHLSKEQRPQ